MQTGDAVFYYTDRGWYFGTLMALGDKIAVVRPPTWPRKRDVHVSLADLKPAKINAVAGEGEKLEHQRRGVR